MHRVILIIMLVLVTSMIGYTWSSKLTNTPATEFTQTESANDRALDTPLSSDNTGIGNTEPGNTKPTEVSANNKQKHKSKLEKDTGTAETLVSLEDFVSLQGQALMNELDSFWIQCIRDNNCKQQLAQLKEQIPVEWFQLLSHYPQTSQEWQVMESSIALESLDSLEQRVGLFKQAAEQVWGELAHQLFSDQVTHLDFTLSTNQFTEVDADDFVEHYQSLISNWQSDATTLNTETPAQQYELAVSLIPDSYTPSQINTIKTELQHTYLDDEQTSSIQAREQQVEQQTQTVLDYHQEFDAFKATLDSQRSGSHSNWDSQAWGDYYQKEVSEFRESFFSGQ